PDSGLPEEFRGVERAPDTAPVALRVTRNGEPEPVERPLPRRLEVWPEDLDGSRDQARAALEAGRPRGRPARPPPPAGPPPRRLAGEAQHSGVGEAEAAQAALAAEAAEADAALAADARDDLATALTAAWRDWIADPRTADLLGPVEWSATEVAPLLADLQALTGESGPALEFLDRVAAEHAVPVRGVVAARREELAQADRAGAAPRPELEAEQAALLAARDPAPTEPPWLSADRPGVPLWRAIDFAEALGPAERGGLEGALLAAGMLTASIEADGTVRAEDGEVLLVAGDTPVEHP